MSKPFNSIDQCFDDWRSEFASRIINGYPCRAFFIIFARQNYSGKPIKSLGAMKKFLEDVQRSSSQTKGFEAWSPADNKLLIFLHSQIKQSLQ